MKDGRSKRDAEKKPRQIWNAEGYAEHARFVSDLGMPVVKLLAPRPGEKILDLGCGDGALTEKIAAAGCPVIGVDASFELVKAARNRGLQALVVDGQDLCFPSIFDAVFSNAAMHWMKRPDDVIAGVFRALRPGGRFVAEMGGFGNIAKIMAAIEAAMARRGLNAVEFSPWYYPTADQYRDKLEAAGFVVGSMELFSRPTRLPSDFSDWMATFAGSFLRAVADAATFVEEVKAALQSELRNADGRWTADYVRLRFAAFKPAF